MSVSQPARCVLSAPSLSLRIRCRNFHTTPKLSARRRPRHTNVKAADMGLITANDLFRPYTAEERAALAQKYTPAQLQAIEAGEEAVSVDDLNTRGTIRTDMGRLKYLDDFSQYRTILDKKPEADNPIDPKERLMSEEEFADGYVNWQLQIEKLQDPNLKRSDPDYASKMRPNRADIEFRASYEVPISTGSKGPQTVPLSQFVPDARGKRKQEEESSESGQMKLGEDPRDPDGVYTELQRKTGLTLDEIFGLKIKILDRHWVSNQTRLGKIQSMYCLAIAGDGKGRLGLGQAKGQETMNTMNLAKLAAIYNMRPIPRYEERTIFGNVKGKVGAVELELMARPPGFGLRCQHIVFEMARAAGIQDLAARVPRGRNKMNTIKATYEALTSQRLPDDIARGLGKKLVDVRKVYYGGR